MNPAALREHVGAPVSVTVTGVINDKFGVDMDGGGKLTNAQTERARHIKLIDPPPAIEPMNIGAVVEAAGEDVTEVFVRVARDAKWPWYDVTGDTYRDWGDIIDIGITTVVASGVTV